MQIRSPGGIVHRHRAAQQIRCQLRHWQIHLQVRGAGTHRHVAKERRGASGVSRPRGYQFAGNRDLQLLLGLLRDNWLIQQGRSSSFCKGALPCRNCPSRCMQWMQNLCAFLPYSCRNCSGEGSSAPTGIVHRLRPVQSPMPAKCACHATNGKRCGAAAIEKITCENLIFSLHFLIFYRKLSKN